MSDLPKINLRVNYSIHRKFLLFVSYNWHNKTRNNIFESICEYELFSVCVFSTIISIYIRGLFDQSEKNSFEYLNIFNKISMI